MSPNPRFGWFSSLLFFLGFLSVHRAFSQERSAGESFLRGELLFQDVVAYCEIGNHRTATPEDARTAEWLLNELKKVGIATETIPFTVPQFFVEKVNLQIDGREVEAFPFWPPKATGTKPLQAKLVELNDANASDLKGNIVLVRTDNTFLRSGLSRDLQKASDAGASGMIAISMTVGGDLFGYGTSKPIPMPVVMVGAKDDVFLTKAASERALVSMVIDGREDPQAQAVEVIGRINGGASGKTIVVSTPYSAWFESGGERGPGIAIWLGLARWAAARQTKTNFLFVASSGHEFDGKGMRSFLEHHAPPPDQVACWLHLGASIATYDWERGPDGSRRRLEKPSTAPSFDVQSEELLTIVRKAFESIPHYQPKVSARNPGELGLMLEKGYRAFGFAGGHPYFHSPNDTAECTGPDLLEPVARALANILTVIENEKGGLK